MTCRLIARPLVPQKSPCDQFLNLFRRRIRGFLFLTRESAEQFHFWKVSLALSDSSARRLFEVGMDIAPPQNPPGWLTAWVHVAPS
jgi:hypothetical protein